MQNKEHGEKGNTIPTEEVVAEEAAIAADDTAKAQEEISTEAPPQVDERDSKIEE